MSNLKIRHLVARPGAAGPLYYWQPSAPLRLNGWKAQRLCAPGGGPVQDLAGAIAAAERLNAEVDAWRAGTSAPDAPPAAALRGKRAKAGTVEALVRDYKATRFWQDLGPKTQREYKWALDAIEAWAGDLPVRAISPEAVEAFYMAKLRRKEGRGKQARVIETPAKAAAILRVLRLLLSNAERLGYIAKGSNPAARAGINYTRAREPQPWTPEQVRHMAATADAMGWRSIGTFIVLNEWIGQRQADLLALAPWEVEAGALVLRQGKSKRKVALAVHLVQHLVERLRQERERPGVLLSTEFLLLHEGTGKRWKSHTFTHVFAEIRAVATAGDAKRGIAAMPSCKGLLNMELRHTAVTRLDEAGVDALGIAGITGHSTKTVVAMLEAHYLTRTAKAGEAAFRKRLAAENDGGK